MYRAHTIPIKILAVFFLVEIDTDTEIYMKMQSIHNRQSNLGKGGKSWPNFKSFEAVVIKAVWC